MKRLSEANPGPSPVIRRWIIKAAKIGIAFEVLTFVGGYGIYYQLQNNPEFAKYMNENHPLAMETGTKVFNYYDSINPFKETIEKWKADKKN